MHRPLALLAALLLTACSSDDAATTTEQEAAAGAAGAAGQASAAGAGGSQAGAAGSAGSSAAGAAGAAGGSAGAPPISPGAIGDDCDEPADCVALGKYISAAAIKCLRPKGWPSTLPGYCTFFCGNDAKWNVDKPDSPQKCTAVGGQGCAPPGPDALRVCMAPKG
jgi:hypothetical protein